MVATPFEHLPEKVNALVGDEVRKRGAVVGQRFLERFGGGRDERLSHLLLWEAGKVSDLTNGRRSAE